MTVTSLAPYEYWIGSREHQGLTVQDHGVPLTSYDVALVPYPMLYADTDWKPAATFDGTLGVWVEDTLAAGLYRIWARAGTGTPNERAIVYCGHIIVRSS